MHKSGPTHPADLVGGLAFIALFPLFFIYHTGIAQSWWPPFVGGLFGYSLVVFLPLLLIRVMQLCQRYTPILTDLRLAIFAALLVWSVGWMGYNLMALPGHPAHAEMADTLVTWIGMFALGIALPLHSPRIKQFMWALWLLIWVLSLATIDATALMSTKTVEGAATYQGLSRSMMVTGFFMVATTPKTPVRILIGTATVVSLFFVGARSELFGFIAAYALTEFLINRRSLGGQLMLAGVALLTALVVVANLDVLGASRQLQVLNLNETGSWVMRGYLTDLAVEQIKASPVMGLYGGHWDIGDGLYAHNALSVWVSLGLVGFLLYMGVCFSAAWVSVKTLIANPLFRTAQMATLVNVSCLLLVILSKPIMWEMPPMGWGLALAAVIQARWVQRARRR